MSHETATVDVTRPSSVSASGPGLHSGEAVADLPDATSSTWGRLADYVELTKPRIAVMATVTVVVGYLLGSRGQWFAGPLPQALVGILLVAASSSALNQWIERFRDRLMPRTADRPLPAGRLSPAEVLAFGLITGLGGVLCLAVTVNLLTAGLAAGTLLLYVAVYTPLKTRTGLCTTIGAIPGALPPVLGYTAASGTLDVAAVALFAVLFLWQFPHFLAIAWLYREQYGRAGMKMVPLGGERADVVGLMGFVYAIALIPVSLWPSRIGLAGDVYFVVALGLGLAYAAAALRFARFGSTATARQLVYSSLLYLPVLLGTLVWNHVALLQ